MDADFATSWDDTTRAFHPIAPLTGPFPRAQFLDVWKSRCAPPDAETFIVHSPDGALPIWIDGGTVRIQGESDLTDYHTPLGTSIDSCAVLLAQRYSGFGFSFDSLPAEGLNPLLRALDSLGASLTTREHAAALVIDLPDEPAAWLASLSKKNRHEVRRKQRRIADLAGEAVYERRSDPQALLAFISMHRAADGDKGTFMTARTEEFFSALLSDVGASIDLLSVDGRPVAAAFGFVGEGAYYLYNSAYEPDAAEAAPGVVLLAMLIERSIADGLSRFDFLKGEEPYKYRLGAVERPLSIIEGRFA